MYSTANIRGFNMIKVKDMFQAFKVSCICHNVSGLNDHWALLDEQLGLNIGNLTNFLNLASEHPKINKIINLDLPGLSQFFKAYEFMNNAFHIPHFKRTTGGLIDLFFIIGPSKLLDIFKWSNECL